MMRARGDGFFAAVDTQPYQPRGVLLGQDTAYSCAAACCRMLLIDYVEGARDDYLSAESFLRAALATGFKGTTIERIPEVLSARGMPVAYQYRRGLTIDDLRRLVARYPAIVFVQAGSDDFHALVVEGVTDTAVNTRDPLPEGKGTASRLARTLFLSAWMDQKIRGGRAVVVLE